MHMVTLNRYGMNSSEQGRCHLSVSGGRETLEWLECRLTPLSRAMPHSFSQLPSLMHAVLTTAVYNLRACVPRVNDTSLFSKVPLSELEDFNW